MQNPQPGNNQRFAIPQPGNNQRFAISQHSRVLPTWFQQLLGQFAQRRMQPLERNQGRLPSALLNQQVPSLYKGSSGGIALSQNPNYIPYSNQYLSFDQGGVVPGPVGQPRIVQALGGETMTPPNQQATMQDWYKKLLKAIADGVSYLSPSSASPTQPMNRPMTPAQPSMPQAAMPRPGAQPSVYNAPRNNVGGMARPVAPNPMNTLGRR